MITAHAQDATGRVIGTVTDPSGGVLVGAKVTVTNTETKVTRETITGDNGSYQVLLVPIGNYSVTAEAPGFRRVVTSDAPLRINESLRIDIKMEVGSTSEVVQVEANAGGVETVVATLGGSVTSQQIQGMPLNGRNVLDLALLQPGVIPSSAGGAGSFSIAGGRQDSVNYVLDGGINSNLLSNGVVFNPNPDAIEEFRILTSNYTAEYGRNAGGVVSVVTKSGANTLHGSAYDYLRNDALNANSFFNNANGLHREVLKRNQFGAYLGGPVFIPKLYNGKNKTFFFVGWQGTRLRNVNAAKNALGPTVDEKNGNFTTCGNPCNATLKDPQGGTFPNNQIPVSRFDPVAVAFANRLLPGALTGTRFFTFQTGINQDLDQGVMRIDHQISQNTRLTGRYFIDQFQNKANYDPHNYTSYSNGSGTRVQNANIGLIQI